MYMEVDPSGFEPETSCSLRLQTQTCKASALPLGYGPIECILNFCVIFYSTKSQVTSFVTFLRKVK